MAQTDLWTGQERAETGLTDSSEARQGLTDRRRGEWSVRRRESGRAARTPRVGGTARGALCAAWPGKPPRWGAGTREGPERAAHRERLWLGFHPEV